MLRSINTSYYIINKKFIIINETLLRSNKFMGYI